ncbi:hypothetical protein BAX97_06490 [Elizabethkingia meningoseptica]|nr:hypothetical protein BAX97_06490 [Elizabethkingia meningoseptica]
MNGLILVISCFYSYQIQINTGNIQVTIIFFIIAKKKSVLVNFESVFKYSKDEEGNIYLS